MVLQALSNTAGSWFKQHEFHAWGHWPKSVYAQLFACMLYKCIFQASLPTPWAIQTCRNLQLSALKNRSLPKLIFLWKPVVAAPSSFETANWSLHGLNIWKWQSLEWLMCRLNIWKWESLEWLDHRPFNTWLCYSSSRYQFVPSSLVGFNYVFSQVEKVFKQG